MRIAVPRRAGTSSRRAASLGAVIWTTEGCRPAILVPSTPFHHARHGNLLEPAWFHSSQLYRPKGGLANAIGERDAGQRDRESPEDMAVPSIGPHDPAGFLHRPRIELAPFGRAVVGHDIQAHAGREHRPAA